MYAIADDEKIANKLQAVANWFREKPEPYDDVNEDERERLAKLADRIEDIIGLYECIVQDHYNRLEKEEEDKAREETKKEIEELMELDHAKLVEKFLELKYNAK